MIRFIFSTSIMILGSLISSLCDEHVYCQDGSQCPQHYECCLTTRGYSCCPFLNGVCCGDDFHCCSTGNKCDLIKKVCVDQKGETKLLTEMAPTSLIYKKGWNELYYNCKDDLNLIREDLFELFSMLNSTDYSQIKYYFEKLKDDGKITKQDCLKFLKEVFG